MSTNRNRAGYHQEYYQANRDRIKAQTKAWRDAHPERMKELHASWYQRNKDHVLTQSKKWREDNPERHRKNHAEKHRKRKFDLTPDEFSAMLLKQNNCCAICQVPFSEVEPNVDHCHTTDFNRDILCNKCNFAAGFADDNPAILRKLADYVERHAAWHAELLTAYAAAGVKPHKRAIMPEEAAKVRVVPKKPRKRRGPKNWVEPEASLDILSAAKSEIS